MFDEDRTRCSDKALQSGFANDSKCASSVCVNSSGIEAKERATLNPFGKLRMEEIPTANRPDHTDRTVGQDVANAAERTQQRRGKERRPKPAFLQKVNFFTDVTEGNGPIDNGYVDDRIVNTASMKNMAVDKFGPQVGKALRIKRLPANKD